jgi:hypothetical protein
VGAGARRGGRGGPLAEAPRARHPAAGPDHEHSVEARRAEHTNRRHADNVVAADAVTVPTFVSTTVPTVVPTVTWAIVIAIASVITLAAAVNEADRDPDREEELRLDEPLTEPVLYPSPRTWP